VSAAMKKLIISSLLFCVSNAFATTLHLEVVDYSYTSPTKDKGYALFIVSNDFSCEISKDVAEAHGFSLGDLQAIIASSGQANITCSPAVATHFSVTIKKTSTTLNHERIESSELKMQGGEAYLDVRSATQSCAITKSAAVDSGYSLGQVQTLISLGGTMDLDCGKVNRPAHFQLQTGPL
jgi:hypothetical protein